MKLVDILTNDTIRIPLHHTEKNKLIAEMVDILHKAHMFKDRDIVFNAVLEREHIMSTGVGDGVAIPHGKADGVKELVASFGVTKQDVDFDSIDNKPIRLIFLLVGPLGITGPHLKALSRISRLMHSDNFRKKLINAKDATDILEALHLEEEKYFDL